MTDSIPDRSPFGRAQAALDALPADASDEQFAAAIADVLLAVGPHGLSGIGLYKLGIKFDARHAPCPVPVDKAGREWCTVTFRAMAEARAWIVKAAMTGHTVARILAADLHSESLRHVRDRKRYREQRAAMSPEQRDELDDEIPF